MEKEFLTIYAIGERFRSNDQRQKKERKKVVVIMCHFQVVEEGLTVLSSSLSRCMFILPSSIILSFLFIYLFMRRRKEGRCSFLIIFLVYITLFKKEDEDDELL